MATKIVGYNIEYTSDPIVDRFQATTHVETPLIRVLTTGTDLDLTNRITASNATGSNNSTPNLRISSGKSTGSAAGGNLIFQISSAGNAGSSLNSFTDVTEISHDSFAIKDLSFSVDTDRFTVAKDTGNTSIAGTLNVGSDVTVTGNLIVNGTTTTINSTTLSVDDHQVELNSVDSPDDTGANNGGILLKGTTNKTFTWLSTTESWTSSEHLNVVSGKSYKLAGTVVLTSDTSAGPSAAPGRLFGRLIGGTTSGDFVTIDDSQTLTNKTFTDSLTYFQDNTTNSKKLQFELSGITTSTTRTLTIPDLSGTIALIDQNQTFTASHTFRNTSGQRFEQASTQDGIVLTGRGGGTGSFSVTIVPETLTANRTLTLRNLDGDIVTTGDTATVTNTMLAGSIANDKLVNSSITVNGNVCALGSSIAITATLSVGIRATGTAGVPTSLDGTSLVMAVFNRANTPFNVTIA